MGTMMMAGTHHFDGEHRLPEWRCTYRLQLNADFDFEDLAEVAAYLHALGVSHAYLSPILQAAHGSTHGYDVADATQISADLGGAAAYAHASETLRANGIGQLLDVVPNHMSTATPFNPWWWDVLRHGPASPYLHYFDFGWRDIRHNFQPLKVPVLEDRYVRVLEAGKISVTKTAGDFRIEYGSSAFPVTPDSYPWLTATIARLTGSERLQAVASAFVVVPGTSTEFWRTLEERLREPGAAEALDEGLRLLSADYALLHELLEQQHYRLAFWRTASESWFYRRFFDINTLAGLRIEQRDVFLVRHREEFRLAREGLVDGFRIDHIDGLRHPERYLRALRQELPGTGIWVEKILGEHESLPATWPVEGTTGYEYLNVLNGLFVDPRGEEALTAMYQAYTGDRKPFADVLVEAKREVIRGLFGGELSGLVELFEVSGEQHAAGRDWSRREVEDALLEYVVALPVYRTYLEVENEPEPAQLQLVSEAIALAASRRADIDPELFAYLGALLRLEVPGASAAELVLRSQQLSGPAMAKGAEDTAFYRYGRLLSLNEVGGEPGHFGVAAGEWHAFCSEIARQHPLTLVTTSTHDTKRGEDARQRLNVLSEAPAQWQALVQDLDAALKTLPPGALPELRGGGMRGSDEPGAADRYVFYQTVVAAWPLEVSRAIEYMRKATREAKIHTSWSAPDEHYEACLEQFITKALESSTFRDRVEAFIADIDPAAVRNSLAQTVLKLTAPGLPDIYRGTEVFSYSLVDPDNRRPVDFAALGQQIAAVQSRPFEPGWLDAEPDLAKLWLVQKTLAVRREQAAAFSQAGSYAPIMATGPEQDRVIAYLRGENVCVVATRWFRRGLAVDAVIELPEGEWQNQYSGDVFSGRPTVAAVLGGLPAALLVRQT